MCFEKKLILISLIINFEIFFQEKNNYSTFSFKNIKVLVLIYLFEIFFKNSLSFIFNLLLYNFKLF